MKKEKNKTGIALIMTTKRCRWSELRQKHFQCKYFCFRKRLESTSVAWCTCFVLAADRPSTVSIGHLLDDYLSYFSSDAFQFKRHSKHDARSFIRVKYRNTRQTTEIHERMSFSIRINKNKKKTKQNRHLCRLLRTISSKCCYFASRSPRWF